MPKYSKVSLANQVKNMVEQPEQPAPQPETKTTPEQPKAQERPFTTGLSISKELYYLLQDLAVKRSREKGGRASVSAIIVQILEQHRADLEKELKS